MQKFTDPAFYKNLLKKLTQKWRWLVIILVGALLLLGVMIWAGRMGWFTKSKNPSSSTQSSRALEIAYLSMDGQSSGGDLWRMGVTGENAVAITTTNGEVTDFDGSKDGNWLAYAQLNKNGGSDIWLIDRNGQNAKKLVDCGADTCSEVAWSPNQTRLAYSRTKKGSDTANQQQNGTTHIWLASISTGQTVLLYADQTITGEDPSWSPDGKKVASYDTDTQKIRILNLETQQEITLPTQLGWVGCWSPDSQKMMYNDIQFINEGSTVLVYIADLNTDKITPFLGQDKSGLDYGLPAWSPDGKWIAISAGNTSKGAGKQLLVMNLDESQSKTITNDLSSTFSSFHWDSSGKKLVFQQFSLGQTTQGPQLLVWDSATGKSAVVAKQAAMPEWLP